MARIRKIPDTWTLEIHAIVLKDSSRAEHEEIGCTKTTRHDKKKLSVLEHQTWWERSSKTKRNARNNKTRQEEAQCTRTSNVVGEELKKRKKEISRGKEDQTFEPSWPNGEYLWISSETRKELIS